MALKTYTGTGVITAADTRYVKYTGKTKGGKPIQIVLAKAICRSNPSWDFAEKNDTVAELQFEGLYEDDKLAAGDLTEPWTLTFDGEIQAGNAEIVLDVGKLEVGTSTSDAKSVGLSRGGGSFVVEREIREITADDDPGAVEGRLDMTSARPKLTLKALQWLTKVPTIYPAIKEVTG